MLESFDRLDRDQREHLQRVIQSKLKELYRRGRDLKAVLADKLGVKKMAGMGDVYLVRSKAQTRWEKISAEWLYFELNGEQVVATEHGIARGVKEPIFIPGNIDGKVLAKIRVPILRAGDKGGVECVRLGPELSLLQYDSYSQADPAAVFPTLYSFGKMGDHDGMVYGQTLVHSLHPYHLDYDRPQRLVDRMIWKGQRCDQFAAAEQVVAGAERIVSAIC